jgi:hypothetical protein
MVAHGASDECMNTYGGSGSLIFDNRVKGFENHSEPFIMGDLDINQTFIHILDDSSLNILLKNRDTITDFADYLIKREILLRSNKNIYSAGEEEMLACYLKYLNEDNEHDFILPNINADGYAFVEGTWLGFTNNEQRQRQLAADRVSYLWDSIIEKFSYHTANDSQYYVSDGGYSDGEKIIRFLAQERRFTRRILSENIKEMIYNTPKHLKRIRVLPTFRDDIYYVVLLFPYVDRLYKSDYDEYRTFRRFYLECTTYVVRLLNPEAKHVIGIAMESGIQPTASSEDLIYFDCSGWNEEIEAQAKEDQVQLGILRSPQYFEINTKEYPD